MEHHLLKLIFFSKILTFIKKVESFIDNLSLTSSRTHPLKSLLKHLCDVFTSTHTFAHKKTHERSFDKLHTFKLILLTCPISLKIILRHFPDVLTSLNSKCRGIPLKTKFDTFLSV